MSVRTQAAQRPANRPQICSALSAGIVKLANKRQTSHKQATNKPQTSHKQAANKPQTSRKQAANNARATAPAVRTHPIPKFFAPMP
ncbi:hypothetical protein PUN4_830116 [Paraburkholderia unamae]|nr:hypothetical protein PUN4_830116 [Paraburkholderia unamae]